MLWFTPTEKFIWQVTSEELFFFLPWWNSLLYFVKPKKTSQSAISGQLSDLYLPAITGTMSNLQAARARLSHSCPYLSTSRRRGSTSSINSQRAPDFNSKQVSRLWLCWEITLQLWTSCKCWVISFSRSVWLTVSFAGRKIILKPFQDIFTGVFVKNVPSK